MARRCEIEVQQVAHPQRRLLPALAHRETPRKNPNRLAPEEGVGRGGVKHLGALPCGLDVGLAAIRTGIYPLGSGQNR